LGDVSRETSAKQGRTKGGVAARCPAWSPDTYAAGNARRARMNDDPDRHGAVPFAETPPCHQLGVPGQHCWGRAVRSRDPPRARRPTHASQGGRQIFDRHDRIRPGRLRVLRRIPAGANGAGLYVGVDRDSSVGKRPARYGAIHLTTPHAHAGPHRPLQAVRPGRCATTAPTPSARPGRRQPARPHRGPERSNL